MKIFLKFFVKNAGIHPLSQFDAFSDGTVVIFIDGCTIADMGSATRNLCAAAFHGSSMGSMSSAIPNTIEKRPTIITTGLFHLNSQQIFRF